MPLPEPPSKAAMEKHLRDGLNNVQIAKIYGRSDTWARDRIVKLGLTGVKNAVRGLSGKPPERKIDVEKLRELCAAGHGIRYLAVTFKAKENSIKNAAAQHGITIPKQRPQVKGKSDPAGDAAFNRACAEFSRSQEAWVPATSSMGWM